MMHYAQTHSPFQFAMEDAPSLRKQLLREINCLEMQLERLRRRDEFLDLVTLQTYEEMIVARKEALNSL